MLSKTLRVFGVTTHCAWAAFKLILLRDEQIRLFNCFVYRLMALSTSG